MAMGKKLRYFKKLLGEDFDEAFKSFETEVEKLDFAGKMTIVYGKYENVPEGIKFTKIESTGEKIAYYNENPQLGSELKARTEWQINRGSGDWYFLGYHHALNSISKRLSPNS